MTSPVCSSEASVSSLTIHFYTAKGHPARARAQSFVAMVTRSETTILRYFDSDRLYHSDDYHSINHARYYSRWAANRVILSAAMVPVKLLGMVIKLQSFNPYPVCLSAFTESTSFSRTNKLRKSKL